MSSDSILIIGAGAAGLAAARDLGRAGRKVTLIEARDRIGGRVFTQKDPQTPVPVELGAEFVHGKSPQLWQCARAANLQLYEVTGRHWYFEDGKLSKSRDFWSKIESLMDEMKSSGEDQSLKQFFDSLPHNEDTQRARAMVTRYVEGFHAGRIDLIGVHGLVKANEGADSINGDKAFRFTDGYGSLMQALRAEAETYGATLHLNTIVREIHWQGDQVEAICEVAGNSGVPPAPAQIFTASAAIITLPLGVLQSDAIRFVPALPGSKQTAIRRLIMGNVLKLNLRFRERFWEQVKVWDEDASTVDLRDAGFFHWPGLAFPTWWTQLPIRAPLLVGWVGGPQADRVRGVAAAPGQILNQALDSLTRILNLPLAEIRGQLEASYFHDWHDDPFTRGAYSYVPVNGLGAQNVLAQPIDQKLFFAGEAMAVGHIGTVHGALQSGQRAAQEIL